MNYHTYRAGEGDAQILHSPLNPPVAYQAPQPTFHKPTYRELATPRNIIGLLAIVAMVGCAVTAVVSSQFQVFDGYNDSYVETYSSSPTSIMLLQISGLQLLVGGALGLIWFGLGLPATKR